MKALTLEMVNMGINKHERIDSGPEYRMAHWGFSQPSYEMIPGELLTLEQAGACMLMRVEIEERAHDGSGFPEGGWNPVLRGHAKADLCALGCWEYRVAPIEMENG